MYASSQFFRPLRLVFAGILVVLAVGCNDGKNDEFYKPNKALTGVDALQSDSSGGFALAYRARNFEFPQDHLSHPEFKHEWWYFTGNLTTAEGNKLGYQLTLFRIGLKADENIEKTIDSVTGAADQSAKGVSKWRTNNIYMGHLAVTDITNQRFYNYEKFSRNALGLAGSELVKTAVKKQGAEEATAIKIWLEDWQIASRGESTFPMNIKAQKGDIAISLTLNPLKPLVFNGYEGLSQRGRKQGNASYYYSITRLESKGVVTINHQIFNVTGNSWFDREWSTSSLERDQAGWDWFSLQLSDGRDLMFYKIRRQDNSMDRYSSGTLVYSSGSYKILNAEDVVVEETDHWQSPNSGIRYPSRWKISVPKEKLELLVEPSMADQENNLTVRYWEGAVKISGVQQANSGELEVNGHGYVELTGYR